MTYTSEDLMASYGISLGSMKVTLGTEVTAVPEPSSYALWGTSLAMALVAARKRTSKSPA
jgi:hypothetical protein